MEAVEFLKEYQRMCGSYFGSYFFACKGCPLDNKNCYLKSKNVDELQYMVEAVEQWSKENPEVQDEEA